MQTESVPSFIQQRYEILQPLGSGGMGTVFQARDVQTGEYVAVKMLNPHITAQDPSLVRRFAREGEALRTLNHPNIVKLLATAQQDGQHFLVMEYVSGGSLADLLKVQPQLPVARVLALALELADALARAHHLHIIHRDVKPANVLLAEDGMPRLTDFGVARMGEAAITQSGVVLGTYPYLAPEAFGAEPLDARADLWAVGIMLFEMLAGQRPFEGDTFSALVGAILTQPMPDLEVLRADVPVALVDLVSRLLAKNRAERIPSARLVGAELESLMRPHWSSETPKPRSGSSVSQAPVTTSAAPDQVVTPRQHNLPAQPTAFVGREAELAEVGELLSQRNVRLVTLVGPGGMGKTRLALEQAAVQLAQFAHGVYFVALAPLTTPESILSAVAEAVKFTFLSGPSDTREPKQQLLDYFRDKSTLLLMDNFEHLMDGVGLVSDILEAAPEVKILATSRERLNLGGETLFRLDGMDFPDWETPQDALEYSAVKLFLQSARRVQPGFEVVPGDLQYLARICRQVRGLPLAILLAAAWIETLSLREISEEISRSLDFLTSEGRDAPTRQRSIRAVFDYSWNLLSVDERGVFQKLAIFRGGCTRDAAQAVSSASLTVLAGLVNKSMLRRDPASGRYEIHELLRQYGEARLAEMPEVDKATRDAYCRYFAAFMAEREPLLYGSRYAQAMAEIAADYANVKAAWGLATAQHHEAEVRRIALCLLDYLGRTDLFREMQTLFESAVAHVEAVNPPGISLGIALTGLGRSHCGLSDWPTARLRLKQAVELLRQHDCPSELACAAAWLAYAERRSENPLFEESYELYRQLGNMVGMAYVQFMQVELTYYAGKLDMASHRLAQAAEVAETLHDDNLLALIRIMQTRLALARGEVTASQTLAEEGLVFAERSGNPGHRAYALVTLGNACTAAGRYSGAEAYFHEAIDIVRTRGNRSYLSSAESLLSFCLYLQGKYAEARQVGLEALDLARNVDETGPFLAGVLVNLAHSTAALKLYAEAETYYREALSAWRGPDSVAALAGLSNLLAYAGQPERATAILSMIAGTPRLDAGTQAVLAAFLARLQTELRPEVFAAAQEQGKLLDRETVIQELLAAPPLFGAA